MAKKIAVINDLSGFGRCSLTAAIPTISVMGVQPCPLPTAVLSAQTGFPSYYCDDYTEKMEHFRQEWEKMGVQFDGIYTGFVASETQIRRIFRFLDTFYGESTFLLVDPVMGDEGRVYKLFTPELLRRMKELALRADVVTPNLTELCLLTGADYGELGRMKGEKEITEAAGELAEKLMESGPDTIVVTGIRFEDAQSGEQMIGNLAVDQSGRRLSAFPYIGGSFSGTGDLFASIIAGGIARGDDIFRTMDLAGEFVERAMKDSAAEGVERNQGTNFEKYLGMLLPGR
ncbi:pyridoxamine kinase [Schaedlerella arabinosiphila]|uniref:pyridoxal kinase n=1 Tax=Schaedlerella arabinosiphila TaxID=2044587 RepID=A0A9X5C9V2_9FIRM|nr:pyridoxamine kinase [Schaedlerella arabinosiphila]KAI4441841.1 Hydroxymethylpyrimidine/phosphomethylpyrimidine kinase [Schaedlerella arabinosiphila]MCI9603400.1 pyridoxamine kinase [Ruminococcus sp.]NDO68787.1 pyridoxamine kinase [Schaedlerella arabinosiphila]